MLKIRMQRTGRINVPSYRIVVTEHTRGPQAGSIVEKVGIYNPKTKERKLDTDRIKYWISVGAKASGTVHNMLISEGVVSGKKINVLPKKHPPVKEGEAAPATEAPAEAAAEPEAKEEPKEAEPSKEEESVQA